DNPFHRPPMDELGYTGRLPLAWRDIDKPTIGAINGVAAGGGLSLAMMLDLRFMAESARLVPTFITRGISPEVGLSWFVTRAIGFAKAFEWLATGDHLSANEARDLGLVNHVVRDEDLLDATLALAKRLAEGPPLALRLTRRVLVHALDHDLRDHLPYEAQCVSIANQTEDAKEGRAALRERRKPKFVGR
ncbi:MAG: enoyl-CoA hydratase-related protein, partial [Dehalococcoidia bacterium]|nr:enoyl-CoA hydratase-related protein [Dehalococcoidia bacterium]